MLHSHHSSFLKPEQVHLFLCFDAEEMAFGNAKNENVSLILSRDAKPRLKWTPELHRRFIDAIDQLGGADRATPKSLMSIMGIHGLTLYHLKSHLQKYRQGKSQNSMSRGLNEQGYKENVTSRMIEEHRERDQETPDGTLEISQALRTQMEVQKQLFQQVEVQKHLQLRIEAQGKYLQSVLQKAQETLALYNSSSMNYPGSSLSLLTEVEGSLSKNAETMQSGRNECSPESSLTSSEYTKRKDDDQEKNQTSNVDENDGAQQSRNSQESKTFMFRESLDLNANV